LVNLDKSACCSPRGSKFNPTVDAEKMDDAKEKSGATGRVNVTVGEKGEEEKSGKAR
jgi:hypothetical protein